MFQALPDEWLRGESELFLTDEERATALSWLENKVDLEAEDLAQLSRLVRSGEANLEAVAQLERLPGAEASLAQLQSQQSSLGAISANLASAGALLG